MKVNDSESCSFKKLIYTLEFFRFAFRTHIVGKAEHAIVFTVVAAAYQLHASGLLVLLCWRIAHKEKQFIPILKFGCILLSFKLLEPSKNICKQMKFKMNR